MPEPAPSRPTLLVVDDTPENLALLGGLLRGSFHVRVANSGLRALQVAARVPHPDLILLDVMMPDMDGFEVLRRLRRMPGLQGTPVIFVTAMDDDRDELAGLELGAVDYIPKPVRPSILLARVRTQLELKQARDQLSDRNASLEHEIARRMRENEQVKSASLHALAMLAEARDNETGNHLHRTEAYVEALLAQLRHLPEHADIDDEYCRMVAKAAPLHDIGKVGIPDAILRKPGRLSASEFEQMKRHAEIGADAIAMAMSRATLTPLEDPSGLPSSGALRFLEIARQIAGGHHEHWDGSGYPAGLAGLQIPLPARLMALADVYDALGCRRVYKPPMPLDEVEQIIMAGRGRQFDPAVVDAFIGQRETFREIARRFADADPSPACLQGTLREATRHSGPGLLDGRATPRGAAVGHPGAAARRSGVGAGPCRRPGAVPAAWPDRQQSHRPGRHRRFFRLQPAARPQPGGTPTGRPPRTGDPRRRLAGAPRAQQPDVPRPGHGPTGVPHTR